MNLAEVNEAINGLENSSFSLSNARNLSALYNVQGHLQNAVQSKPDSLEQELNDILPEYKKYCEIKRLYQLNQASENDLIDAMRRVCKEVNDFLLILYRNTDMKIERKMIETMIDETKAAL